MIQYRYDAARQPSPALISYSSPTAPRLKKRRSPGLPGGRGSGKVYPAMLRDIERAILEFGMTATSFGREAARDPKLVFRLRKGAGVTVAMRDRLLAFIATLENGEA